MIRDKHFRPFIVCTSAFMLAACSTAGGYTAISGPAPTPQIAQRTGTSELQRIADELAASGDHKAAIPIYRHLGATKGDPAALNALANSLMAQGINDEARKILTMLVERGQATTDTWYNLGKIKLTDGKYDEALSAFNYAAVMAPGSPKPLSGKAIALAAMGRTGDAIAAFQTNSDTVSLSNKALIFAASGRPKAAIALLEPIIKSGNNNARDRQNLAMAYLLDGQEKQAFQIARLDLDAATTSETFTFYRSLKSLENSQRMQALITGIVKPEWTRTEYANLELAETETSDTAAKRIIEEYTVKKAPIQLAVAKESETSRENYILTKIPPLLEPEGWALQVGAYRTIKNLMRGWTILYRQNGDLLQKVPPRRSEVNFASSKKGPPNGFYYRLNAGPLKTYAEAKELCDALKARDTSCWIRPPEKAEGKSLMVKKKDSTPKPKAPPKLTDTVVTASIG